MILLRFPGGIPGAASVSDATTAPWRGNLTGGGNATRCRTGRSLTLWGSPVVPGLGMRADRSGPTAPRRLSVTTEPPTGLRFRGRCEAVRGIAAAGGAARLP